MASLADRIGTSASFTRLSIGTQLRTALDDLTRRGWIDEWALDSHEDGRLGYRVTCHGVSTRFTPGEAMAFVNSYGHDVRFGKAPS